MGKAWPITSIGVCDIENDERNHFALLFVLLYFYIMMKALSDEDHEVHQVTGQNNSQMFNKSAISPRDLKQRSI